VTVILQDNNNNNNNNDHDNVPHLSAVHAQAPVISVTNLSSSYSVYNTWRSYHWQRV